MDPFQIECWAFQCSCEDYKSDDIVRLLRTRNSSVDENETKYAHHRKPRKNEVKYLIQHLNVYPKLAHERMGGAVYVVKMDYTVHCSKE